MTRVEALDIARDLLNDYISGSPDADIRFEEAERVLTCMRNTIQKQRFKRIMKGEES